MHATYARYECQTYCYCNNTQPKADHELWAIAINKLEDWIGMRKAISDGTMTTYDFIQIAKNGTSTVLATVEAPSPDVSKSNGCTADNCTLPWDTSVLGAIPGRPPPPISDLVNTNQTFDIGVEGAQASVVTSGVPAAAASLTPGTCAKENTDCSRTSDCGTGGGCTCMSWASSIDRTFVSKCLAVLALSLLDVSPTVPRDLTPRIDGPCACNCTYVSHGCCDAPFNGIIHESRDLHLGYVQPWDGVFCDDTTGDMRKEL